MPNWFSKIYGQLALRRALNVLGARCLGLIESIFNFGKLKAGESVDEISQRLVNFVLKSAFEVFKDEEFRRCFDFVRQKQEEQNRLFNELGVTSLCLLLLVLEDVPWRNQEKIHFWREVRQRTPKMFQDWLKELGLPRPYVSLWGELIQMRYKEYQRDRRQVRQELEKYDQEFANFDIEAAKSAYVRFMAVAIGAIHHLRRGKTSPKDPFFRHLQTWLGVLNSLLEKEISRG